MAQMGLEIKQLEDWATFLDAQEYLGYGSNQAVHDLVFVQKAFDSQDLRYIQMRTQPLYLVRWSALREVKCARDALAANRPAYSEAKVKQLRRQVREVLGARMGPGRLDAAQRQNLSAVLGRPVEQLSDLDGDQLTMVLDKLRATSA